MSPKESREYIAAPGHTSARDLIYLLLRTAAQGHVVCLVRDPSLVLDNQDMYRMLMFKLPTGWVFMVPALSSDA